MLDSEGRDRVELDGDLQAVIEFMQTNLPADKLVRVAAGLNQLAPSLWGHHPQRDVLAIQISPEPILPAEKIQSAAIE